MTTMSDKAEDKGIHPFERAGLGIAPFRFVGAYESKFQAVPGDPNCPIQPGTCCDYCFQGIMLVCSIRSSDGKTFKVGSDCVLRTGDKRITTEAKRALNKRNTARSHERADARIAAAIERLPAVEAALRAMPHPYPWQAEKGRTMWDRVTWLLRNAGRKGKVDAAKIVEQVGT